MARRKNGQFAISDTYSRRLRLLESHNQYQRLEAAKDLKKGLVDATQIQLYDVTTLPVTHDMLNSIGVTINVSTNTVTVGYILPVDGKVPEHPKYRLNMKGKSKLGGHRLDMQPSVYIRENVNPKLIRRARILHKRTLEAK
jgi:hypothetical protein